MFYQFLYDGLLFVLLLETVREYDYRFIENEYDLVQSNATSRH